MLIEQIKADQLQARKDRNTNLAQLLTTFYSEAAMIGKNDGDRVTTDKEVHAVAKKFIKNANEVMANLSEGDDRYCLAVFEVVNLTEYLPPQLDEVELKAVIETIIQENQLISLLHSNKMMGAIMKELKTTHEGQYDGKTASQIIRDLLK